ncbi:TPA: hypothetical protein ACG61E_001927 [Streptococcus agalactiae]
MVQAIKQHKISSQELVEQAIYKIEEQNVSVNAVAELFEKEKQFKGPVYH